MMMDSPFFRRQWNSSPRPRNSPSVRGIPVKPQTTSSPKVVSIPVRFAESDRARSASALKIQKVFRGFLVRKSVKRIVAIRSEVEEIERRISLKETVDLIRRDPKERLKVNETLMALLLKLDSIRGVDSGVRDCRKAVIRRAIALQEKVDAIVAGDQTLSVVDCTDTEVEASEVDEHGDCPGNSDAFDETVDQAIEIKDPVEFSVDCEDVVNQDVESQGKPSDILDSASLLSDHDCLENAVDQTLGAQDPAESVLLSGESEVIMEPLDKTEDMHDSNDSINVAANEALKFQVSNVSVDEPDKNSEEMDLVEVGVDSEIKANEELSITKEIKESRNTATSVSECVEEGVGTSQTENQSDSSINSQSLTADSEENTSVKREDGMEISPERNFEGNPGAGQRDDNKRNRELLERMMEDNEKLMGLMTELYVKNETQTRLLSSLLLRVEQLERAFMCERMRRKKKRQQAAGTVNCSERSPDHKRCGKRL